MSLKRELLIILSIKLIAMGLIWQLWFSNPVDQHDSPSLRANHLLGAPKS